MDNKKRQTHCFVPGCKSGNASSRTGGKRASLFAVPKELERFRAWARAMLGTGKHLEARSVICELHFDERFIVRHFTHTINGETIKIPRDRVILTDDAVPALSPDSKEVPRKRVFKTPTECFPSTVPPVPRSPVISGHSAAYVIDARSLIKQEPTESGLISAGDDHTVGSGQHGDTQRWRLPGEHWSKHVIRGAADVVAYSTCSFDGTAVSLEKVVVFRRSDNGVRGTVFVQESTVKIVDNLDVRAAEALLQDVEKMRPCQGLGSRHEFQVPERYRSKTCGAKQFSNLCTGVVSGGTALSCVHCRYLRKLLLNQMSCKHRRPAKDSVDTAHKLKLTQRKLWSCKHRLSKLQAEMAELKQYVLTTMQSNQNV